MGADDEVGADERNVDHNDLIDGDILNDERRECESSSADQDQEICKVEGQTNVDQDDIKSEFSVDQGQNDKTGEIKTESNVEEAGESATARNVDKGQVGKACEIETSLDATQHKDDQNKAKKRGLEEAEEVVEDLASKDASLIADHYNSIKAVKREERHQSRILHLRNLNNWIKHILIAEFGSKERGIKDVLDLACGKGGDLQKWKKAQIRSWFGIDIAEESVEEARRRYKDMPGPIFNAQFHVLDAFHKDWAAVVGQNSFHAISCQFAYHYSFETEASARHSIKMISKYLRPGGYFFGTIPDFSEIRRRLQGSGQRKIGNDIYSLALDEGTVLEPDFGQRYFFDLAEAIESCPEYFISFHVLEALAEEVGLESVLCSQFPEFFETFSRRREHQESVERMRVVDRRSGGMMASGEELEVASLYLAFCFRKKA